MSEGLNSLENLLQNLEIRKKKLNVIQKKKENYKKKELEIPMWQPSIW